MTKVDGKEMVKATLNVLGWHADSFNQTKFDEEWDQYDSANLTMSNVNMTRFMDSYLWGYEYEGADPNFMDPYYYYYDEDWASDWYY